MKKVWMIALFSLALSGCAASVYTKQVQVNKDANGNITGSTETETIQQQGSSENIKFQHLKIRD